jgi:hypothetical protein
VQVVERPPHQGGSDALPAEIGMHDHHADPRQRTPVGRGGDGADQLPALAGREASRRLEPDHPDPIRRGLVPPLGSAQRGRRVGVLLAQPAELHAGRSECGISPA